jgi:hypothetical protein
VFFRAQGGYLSTSALLEAQQNITNIYGKVSQQMTSAKQSGSSPLARLPNLSFESMPPSSDEVFDWLES